MNACHDPTPRRASDSSLSEPPRFRTLLAEIDGAVLGYAMYFFTYSSFRARPTLYLEDVFVVPDRRGEGAGVALFRACAREAVANACARMEWQGLSWDTPSIHFFKSPPGPHPPDLVPLLLLP